MNLNRSRSAIAKWTAVNRHAREAYWADMRVRDGVCATVGCGRRKSVRSRECRACCKAGKGRGR